MTTTLTIADLEYELPDDRIATKPVTPRSSAKMLVVGQSTFEHMHVVDLPAILPEDALLVVNETSVLPARFFAKRTDTGGKVEGLFLNQEGSRWNVMLKSNGKLREGIVIKVIKDVQFELVTRDGNNWQCVCSDNRSALEVLSDIGTTPIPPYIVRARKGAEIEDCDDRLRYQTLYADILQRRSVAAPTAGLHFDEKLLEKLEQMGVELVPVTLDIGAGTFKGIETEKIEDHEMHVEHWSVSQHSLDAIKNAKTEGRSIIAVGTTSVRTLESLSSMESWPNEGGLSGGTRLMITPPYTFKLVDGMLTNFHLPKSTLLTLVAAMIGIDRLKSAYAEAICLDYRFYSYGDAMFIRPN